jgi:tRNA-Thr(GGU) m(6)t(6)A37 methyltransferase TsaA
VKKRNQDLFSFQPIGYVQTPFKDKFGIPRQPGLASQAKGIIKFDNDPDIITALRGLELFSHIWIVFVFHEHGGKNWKPSIRPPRLGGAKKVGVLSSRSPHRPNPIGLSAVMIEKIILDSNDGPEIHVGGVDLLDGTPVLDIKPYIPYADSIPDANPGWASEAISRKVVSFSQEASEELLRRDPKLELNLKTLIVEVLELDPRPAFKKRKASVEDPKVWGSRYGFAILGCEVKYEIQENCFHVYEILDSKNKE